MIVIWSQNVDSYIELSHQLRLQICDRDCTTFFLFVDLASASWGNNHHSSNWLALAFAKNVCLQLRWTASDLQDAHQELIVGSGIELKWVLFLRDSKSIISPVYTFNTDILIGMPVNHHYFSFSLDRRSDYTCNHIIFRQRYCTVSFCSQYTHIRCNQAAFVQQLPAWNNFINENRWGTDW